MNPRNPLVVSSSNAGDRRLVRRRIGRVAAAGSNRGGQPQPSAVAAQDGGNGCSLEWRFRPGAEANPFAAAWTGRVSAPTSSGLAADVARPSTARLGGDVAPHPVAAGCLGLVERTVRARQRARRFFAGQVRGNADRRRHAERAVVEADRCNFQPGANPFGGGKRALRIDVSEQQHVLLAAPARNRVTAANHRGANAGDGAQGFVAGGVPMGVVHTLEMIDVEDCNGYRLCFGTDLNEGDPKP